MIGHVFQSHYHTLQVQLFGGDSSNIEASLEHSNIGTTTSIQEKSAKWPTSQGGPLDDLQQYETEKKNSPKFEFEMPNVVAVVNDDDNGQK